MTNVTRKELELCARLLGQDYSKWPTPDHMLERIITEQREALARAAKLCIDYGACTVVHETAKPYMFKTLQWPADGTESECIIKAAAAVQIEREKANG